MTKYALFSTQFDGQIIFGFSDAKLAFFNCYDADLTDVQYSWLVNHLPIKESDLHNLARNSQTVRIEELPEDLSFDRFWKAYNYKVGNKKRAEKLWKALPAADKIQALKCIPLYDNYLRWHPNMERLYAETFLYQRRFENQYK